MTLDRNKNGASNDRPLVLVVEDAASYSRHLCRILKMERGLRTVEAADGLRALTLLTEIAPDVALVVADLRLDGPDHLPQGPQGDEVLAEVGRRYPHIRRVLLTAYATGDLVLRGAEAKPPFEVVSKHLDPWIIAETIEGLARG